MLTRRCGASSGLAGAWPIIGVHATALARGRRRIATAAATSPTSKPRRARAAKQQQQPSSEQQPAVGLDAGWGVEVVAPQPALPAQPRPQGSKGKKGQQKHGGSGYVPINSAEGVMGLSLLQQTLAMEGADLGQDLDELRATMRSAAATEAKRRKAGRADGGAPGGRARSVAVFSDTRSAEEEVFVGMEEDEDEEQESSSRPEFQLTFGSDGQVGGCAAGQQQQGEGAAHEEHCAERLRGRGAAVPLCRVPRFEGPH